MHRKLGPKAFSSILNLNLLNQKLKLAGEQDIEVEILDETEKKRYVQYYLPELPETNPRKIFI